MTFIDAESCLARQDVQQWLKLTRKVNRRYGMIYPAAIELKSLLDRRRYSHQQVTQAPELRSLNKTVRTTLFMFVQSPSISLKYRRKWHRYTLLGSRLWPVAALLLLSYPYSRTLLHLLEHTRLYTQISMAKTLQFHLTGFPYLDTSSRSFGKLPVLPSSPSRLLLIRSKISVPLKLA